MLFFYVVALNFLVATKFSVIPFPEKALPSQTPFASQWQETFEKVALKGFQIVSNCAPEALEQHDWLFMA